MPIIETNHIHIAYNTFGNPDAPPLFLVHGLTANRTSMFPLAERLSTHFHVFAYDCRGHGHSSKPAHYTLNDHAQDLLALIRAAGYRQAAVFGLSMGSYIAACAAASSGGAIDRLVLVVTKPNDDGSGSSVARLLKAEGLDLGSSSEEETLTVIKQALWSPSTPPARRDEIIAAKNECSRRWRMPILSTAQRTAVNEALRGFDLRPLLPRITCPTLVIAARHDGLNPPEAGQAVAALIPHSRFEILEHSGHMIEAEETDKLAQTTLSFLLC